MQITYGSVCSGVEAASLAWEPLGLEPAWFSEIDAFPSAILAHRWPNVANLGDMRTIREKIENGTIEAPYIFVGGTPCQSFSINGLRQGLDSSNGQLCLEHCRIFAAIADRREREGQSAPVCVWENVVGALSSRDNAFGEVLAMLAGSEGAYSKPTTKGGRPASWPNGGFINGSRCRVAWRVLDAQGFGVPQRRRRVFIVASPRASGVDPREVLFEQEEKANDSKGVSRGEGAGISYKTLTTANGGCQNARGTFVVHSGRWRALTPLEEERRQGFPDGHTNINGATDRKRYKAIGNSMAVPVMRWIGKRLRAAITLKDQA